MKINIPRLRHKKLKNLGKNLHWATSSTNKDPNPLENPGGSKNEYFLHDDPIQKQNIIRPYRERRRDRYIKRKALSRRVKAEPALIGTFK